MNMANKRIRLLAISIVCILAAVATSAAQKPAVVDKTAADSKQASTTTSSAAHAELLLRKTELQAELESLVLDYTEDYPKVKEIRFELTLFDRDLARLSKVKPADASKLTVALGKLMLRRIELEVDLWKLQQTYKDEHPDVKRTKRKIEIFESSVNQILN